MQQESSEESSDEDSQPAILPSLCLEVKDNTSKDVAEVMQERNNLSYTLKFKQTKILKLLTDNYNIGDEVEIAKNFFQCERIKDLDVQEYTQFEQCRQHNFMSKGRRTFLNFTKVRSSSPKDVEFVKLVECLAYVLRSLLKLAVELQLCSSSEKSIFEMRSKALTRNQYETSFSMIDDILRLRIDTYKFNLIAFETYGKKMQKELCKDNPRDIKDIIVEIEFRWRTLDTKEKSDLICRYIAEQSLKKHLGSCREDLDSLNILSDWDPLGHSKETYGLSFNYYGEFLRNHLLKLVNEQSKFKKELTLNSKVLEQIYLDVWLPEVRQSPQNQSKTLVSFCII